MESKKKASDPANKKPKRPRKTRASKNNDIKKALASLETPDRPFNPKLFSSVMEEFLHSFIVIGYTQNGEPVALTAAKDQQQMDALHTSLQRFIAMFMGGGQLPGAEEPQEDE